MPELVQNNTRMNCRKFTIYIIEYPHDSSFQGISDFSFIQNFYVEAIKICSVIIFKQNKYDNWQDF